ncbi:hypothetical protein GQ600_23546 [Phytophthora cactorum]|nr:hypothetical protein GQ600_23546 [Phytophthora cactorum]
MVFNCQLGIALMFGSISVLGSPATVMAIKIELNSVGPFTSLMLGATMTAEFVVLVSFSISRIVCSIYCAELDVSIGNLAFTMSIVLANILVGVLLAGMTVLIFKIPGGTPHEHAGHDIEDIIAGRSVSTFHSRRTGHKMTSVDRDMAPHPHNAYNEETPVKNHAGVKFEPLLVLMIASCIAGHHTGIRHDMHVILDTVAPYMFLPFFVMTGAALKLDQVLDAIPLMSLYVGLRYVAIFIACYFGGRFLLKLTPKQYNNLWLTMTPQAGVALGLATEVQAMSDEPWAAEFAATIVAAVVVNQIIGPVLCAMGLNRAGETLKDRVAEGSVPSDDNNLKSLHSGRFSSIHGGNLSNLHGGNFSSVSMFDAGRRMSSPAMTMGKDPRSLLPFYKVQNAVVIGDDEVAFEVALDLSLYGAQVNVPLLDQERASKWQKMNETILKRTANGDLITFKNTLKDRDNAKAMSAADVLIFTGDVNRRAGDPAVDALANIATRMALLDQKLAEALSNEISTTSDFSTASYFLQPNSGYRDSLSELCLDGRSLALGRSVVNHHSVDYDRLAEVFAAENLPMPPPPSRVAMFGTSGAGFDPFSSSRSNRANFFVMLMTQSLALG